MKNWLWFVTCFVIIWFCVQDQRSLAKINPQDAYDCGIRDGVLKGISISYKTFRGMYKDKKNRQEYLRRLVSEIQLQKEFERRMK